MADKEWFTVELPSGHEIEGDFPNKETAAEFARRYAPEENQPLTVVRYSRREIRTFTKRITIEEADVTAPVVGIV